MRIIYYWGMDFLAHVGAVLQCSKNELGVNMHGYFSPSHFTRFKDLFEDPHCNNVSKAIKVKYQLEIKTLTDYKQPRLYAILLALRERAKEIVDEMREAGLIRKGPATYVLYIMKTARFD
ncbi:hypothetical protein Ciccas_001151 [Cichlidogyrus casuarinus]|uniref:DNA-directed DNA polymerase n=1 Tax=Cichlidogyrus casuarinus TaxID=1844966 RepID=A0ABD2QKW2_9PLAT